MFYTPERRCRKLENRNPQMAPHLPESNGCGVRDNFSDGIVVSCPEISEIPGGNGGAVMNRTNTQEPDPQHYKVELINRLI
ncbi:hypothetical protein BTUL_0047g00560 [Botrytis tulipae]|uniref:Uncharacterized protein n=1 Tax=Botrytis tulipae TaxID=87230 RepID=A0A4Z1ER59_9HELO|nr:hypothetical protein BTUL_0047g00560 [Botrytis tulipae]